MPELPDLTLYARNLKTRVHGQEIVSADVFTPAKVNLPQPAFADALIGARITDITRNGKELFFLLSSGEQFAVHLMLFGRFDLAPTAELFRINAKAMAIGFAGGTALSLSDWKHMAKVTVHPPKPAVPDALSDAFTLPYLAGMAQKKATMNIKAFLIDQKIVRGIGNAYVDEILWKAGISPKSFAGKIPPEYLEKLYDAIRWVLEDAIAQIERISPDIIAGEERSFLRVHNPKRRTTDDGEPILCEEVAKKRTYYTASQRLFW